MIQRHDGIKIRLNEKEIMIEKMEELMIGKNEEIEKLKKSNSDLNQKVKDKNIKIKQALEDAKNWEAHFNKMKESQGGSKLTQDEKDKKIKSQEDKIKQLEEEKNNIKENYTNASNLNVQLNKHMSMVKEENDILVKRYKRCTDPGCVDVN